MRPRRVMGVFTACVVLLIAGADAATVRSGATAEINPAGISIERVVASSSDLRGTASRFLSRLAGKGDEPLFNRPYGVSWLGEDLLIADTGAGFVLRIHDRGGVSRTRPGAVVQPVAAISCLGGVVVSDSASGGVALFDANLTFERWLVRGLGRPTGMACLDDEVAVVDTSNHQVVIVGRDGMSGRFGSRGDGPGELNFPTLIARDGEDLVVGDALNFRVQRFDRSGRFIDAFGRLGDSAGTMPRMKGLAIDHQRRIWISDALLDQIAVYSSDGTFLMAVGHSGTEPGGFSFPAGIAFGPGERLAVADCYNRRLQILHIPASREERR